MNEYFPQNQMDEFSNRNLFKNLLIEKYRLTEGKTLFFKEDGSIEIKQSDGTIIRIHINENLISLTCWLLLDNEFSNNIAIKSAIIDYCKEKQNLLITHFKVEEDTLVEGWLEIKINKFSSLINEEIDTIWSTFISDLENLKRKMEKRNSLTKNGRK